MSDLPPPNRCRLVLIAPPSLDAARLADALAGGDVASLILPAHGLGEAAFQDAAEALVPVAQQAGAAAVVAGDLRIAGRVGADGVHLEAAKAEIADAIARVGNPQKMLVGAGGIKTCDDALELGELRPDYVFFGRFGYDNKPEPHARNLGNSAAWWASMVEIPCVLLGGASLASVEGGGRDRRRVRRLVRPPFSVKASILAGRSRRPTPCSTKKRRVSELRAVACAPPASAPFCCSRPSSPCRPAPERQTATGRVRPPSSSTPTRFGGKHEDPAYGAYPARLLQDRLRSGLAAGRKGRQGRAGAGRGDPGARPGQEARRGRGCQMVPGSGRAGPARGPVPVRPAPDRRALRQAGQARRPSP